MSRIARKPNLGKWLVVLLISQLLFIVNKLSAAAAPTGAETEINDNLLKSTQATVATTLIDTTSYVIKQASGGSLQITTNSLSSIPLTGADSATAIKSGSPNSLGDYTINIENSCVVKLPAAPTSTLRIIDFRTAAQPGQINIHNGVATGLSATNNPACYIKGIYGTTTTTDVSASLVTAIDFTGATSKLNFIQYARNAAADPVNYVIGNILGSNSSDALDIRAGTITGNINLGSGNNSISNSGTITGNTTFVDGGNTFTVSGIINNGNTTFGNGDNTFTVSGTINTGNTTFGNGANTYTLSGTVTTSDTTFGNGDNTFTLNSNGVINTGNITFGNGANIFTLSSSTSQINSNRGSITFGSGKNIFTSNGTITSKSITLGNGNNSFTVGGGNISNGTITMGTGSNNLSITGGTISDSFIIGDGTNSLSITGGTISNGTITLGGGNNSLSITGGTISDSFIFGDGDNNLNITMPLATTALTSNFKVGNGNNEFILTTGRINGKVTLGTGDNNIRITSNGTIDNINGDYVINSISGSGNNVINLLGTLNGKINMSATGKNTLNIGSITNRIDYRTSADLNNLQTINIKGPATGSGSNATVASIAHRLTGVSTFTIAPNTTVAISTGGSITTVSDSGSASTASTSNSGGLTNNGTLTVTDGSIFGFNVFNNNTFTINGTKVNYNSFFINSNTLNITRGDLSGIANNKGDLTNDPLKTITVSSGGTIGNDFTIGLLSNSGSIINSGTITLTSLENKSKATLDLRSGSRLIATGNIINDGILLIADNANITANTLTQSSNLTTNGNINAAINLGNAGLVLNIQGGTIGKITGGTGIDTINISNSVTSDNTISAIENINIKNGTFSISNLVSGLSKKLIIEYGASMNIASGGDISGGGSIKNLGNISLQGFNSGGSIGATVAMGNLNNYGSIDASGGDLIVADFINNANTSSLTMSSGVMLVNSFSNKLGSVSIMDSDLSVIPLLPGKEQEKPINYAVLNNATNQSITIKKLGSLGSSHPFDIINNNGIIKIQDDAVVNCIQFNNLHPKGSNVMPTSLSISGGKLLIGSPSSAGSINNYFGSITINSTQDSLGDLSSASDQNPSTLVNYYGHTINVLGFATIGDNFPLGNVNNQGTINASGSKIVVGDVINGDGLKNYRGILNITKGNVFTGNINNNLGSIEIFSTTDVSGVKYVGDLSSANRDLPSTLTNEPNQTITVYSGTIGSNRKFGTVNNSGIINVNNNISVGDINNLTSNSIISLTGGVAKVSDINNKGKISISSNSIQVDLSSINSLKNTVITNESGAILDIYGTATLGANGRLDLINNNGIVNASGSNVFVNNFNNNGINAKLNIISSNIRAKEITNTKGTILIQGGGILSIKPTELCTLVNFDDQNIFLEGIGGIGSVLNYQLGEINNYGNIKAFGGNIVANLFVNNKTFAGSGGVLHVTKGNMNFGNILNDYGEIIMDGGDLSGMIRNTATLTNGIDRVITLNNSASIGALYSLEEINNKGTIDAGGGNIFTKTFINNAANASLNLIKGALTADNINNNLGVINNTGGDLSGRIGMVTSTLTNAVNQNIIISNYGTVGANEILGSINNNGVINAKTNIFRTAVLNNNPNAIFNLTNNYQSGFINQIYLKEVNNQGTISLSNINFVNSTNFIIDKLNNLDGSVLNIKGNFKFGGELVNHNATINIEADMEFTSAANSNLVGNNNKFINNGTVFMLKPVTLTEGKYILERNGLHITSIDNGTIKTLTLVNSGLGPFAELASGSTIDFQLNGDFILKNQDKFTVIKTNSSSGIDARDLSSINIKGDTSLISYNLSVLTNDLIATVNKKSIADLVDPTRSSNNSTGAMLDYLIDNSQSITDPNLIATLCRLERLPSTEDVINVVNQLAPDPVIGEISSIANNTFVPEVISQRIDLIARSNVNQFKPYSGYSAGSMIANDGLWIKSMGGSIEQKNRDKVAGYNANSVGVAFGLDANIFENTWLGLSISSLGTHLKSKDYPAKRTNVISYQISFYGSHTNEKFYIDLYGAMAANKYKTTRYIQLVNQTALANFKAVHPSSKISLGYIFKENNFNFIPNVSLHYSTLYQNPYNETGVSGVGLQKISSTSFNQLEAGIGVKFALTDEEEQDRMYKPDLHFMLLHDFKATQQGVTAQFMGGGGAFNVPGAIPDKTTYNIGAGVIFVHKNQLNVTFNYEWRKKNKFIGHSGSLAVRYEF